MDRWAARDAAKAAGDTIPDTAEERISQFKEQQAARKAAEPVVPLTWGAEKKIGIHLGDTVVRVAVIDSDANSPPELVSTFPYSVLGWQLAGRGQTKAPPPRLCHLTRMLGGMQSGASALLADMYADVLRHSRKQLEARYGQTSAKLTAVVASCVESEVEAATGPTADCLCAAGMASSAIVVARCTCESAAAVSALALGAPPDRSAQGTPPRLALVLHVREPVRGTGDVQTLQASLVDLDSEGERVRASRTHSVEAAATAAAEDGASGLQTEKLAAALQQLAAQVCAEAAVEIGAVDSLLLLGYEVGYEVGSEAPTESSAPAESGAEGGGDGQVAAAVGALRLDGGGCAQVRQTSAPLLHYFAVHTVHTVHTGIHRHAVTPSRRHTPSHAVTPSRRHVITSSRRHAVTQVRQRLAELLGRPVQGTALPEGQGTAPSAAIVACGAAMVAARIAAAAFAAAATPAGDGH